jgi:hypothetical protein
VLDVLAGDPPSAVDLLCWQSLLVDGEPDGPSGDAEQVSGLCRSNPRRLWAYFRHWRICASGRGSTPDLRGQGEGHQDAVDLRVGPADLRAELVEVGVPDQPRRDAGRHDDDVTAGVDVVLRWAPSAGGHEAARGRCGRLQVVTLLIAVLVLLGTGVQMWTSLEEYRRQNADDVKLFNAIDALRREHLWRRHPVRRIRRIRELRRELKPQWPEEWAAYWRVRRLLLGWGFLFTAALMGVSATIDNALS